MMSLEEWAQQWNVPPIALQQLALSVLHRPKDDDGEASRSEAYIQSEVRLEAAQHGRYLFRNNIGAGKMESGNFIRFGLGNDSAPLNKVLKSADLIGWTPVLITSDMVGKIIAQFLSREIKAADWKYSGTAEENAQLKWAALVNQFGGDAKIVTGSGSFGP